MTEPENLFHSTEYLSQVLIRLAVTIKQPTPVPFELQTKTKADGLSAETFQFGSHDKPW